MNRSERSPTPSLDLGRVSQAFPAVWAAPHLPSCISASLQVVISGRMSDEFWADTTVMQGAEPQSMRYWCGDDEVVEI